MGKKNLKKFPLCGEDFSTAIMNDHMRIIHELQSFKATEKPANWDVSSKQGGGDKGGKNGKEIKTDGRWWPTSSSQRIRVGTGWEGSMAFLY
jgi:hypothetical protein